MLYVTVLYALIWNNSSPLKNAYIDDFDLLCVLQLCSDFDAQMKLMRLFEVFQQPDDFCDSFNFGYTCSLRLCL